MPGDWMPQRETGISQIDSEHHELVAAAEALGAALVTSSEGEVARTLEGFTGSVLKRFESEERWMRMNRFPLAREHVVKHDQFIARLAAMSKDFGEEGVSAVLKLRLRNALAWLEDHIEDDDRNVGRQHETITRIAAATAA
jgi:hemerythrin-like metal-binding protein